MQSHAIIKHAVAGLLELVDGAAALPPPPPLAGNDASDGDALVDTHGEFAARCLYSKQWQHRQAATRYIAQHARAAGVQDDAGYRNMLKYLCRGLKDTVAAVAADAAAAVREGVEGGQRGGGGGAARGALVAGALPALCERLGDGNTRISVRLAAVQGRVVRDHVASRPMDPKTVPHPLTPLFPVHLLSSSSGALSRCTCTRGVRGRGTAVGSSAGWAAVIAKTVVRKLCIGVVM
jgi:hypothetical protein